MSEHTAYDHYGDAHSWLIRAEYELSVSDGHKPDAAAALAAAKIAEVHIKLGDRATEDGYFSEGAQGFPEYVSPFETKECRGGGNDE